MTQDELSVPVGVSQPPPKLLIDRLTEGEVTCLRLAGFIDEQFDGTGLAATITSRYLILDVGGVERISSFGIRQWVDFIGSLTPRVAGIYYIECSPKFIDQFNMVANFVGSGYIVSFYAPYRCDPCDQERRLLFRTDEETPLWKAGQAPPSICPTCGNPEDFEEVAGNYFSNVAQQPSMPIAPPVMNFLRVHLNYGQGGQRKLRIEKRIEGRTTYLKLAGDLDSDLRAQKLADGLEGELVMDLSGILSIDPVGTAQWRKLMRILAAKTGGDEQVDRIHFVAVPSAFLERLGRAEDLTSKGQVLSLLIPYNCSHCRAITQHPVDFLQRGDELRAGRVPRIKCSGCSGPVTCVVSETWITRLQALPVPQFTEELQRTIARLMAPPSSPRLGTPTSSPPIVSDSLPPSHGPGWTQPQQVLLSPALPPTPSGLRVNPNAAAGTHAGMSSQNLARPDPGRSMDGLRAAQMSGTNLGPPKGSAAPPKASGFLGKVQNVPGLLPSLLALLLVSSGAIVYRILSEAPSAHKDSAWRIVETAQPSVPPWHDPAYSGKKDLAFLGHSWPVPDRTEAQTLADAAAQVDLIQHLADTLAHNSGYAEWEKVVPPLYSQSVQAARSDLDKAALQLQKLTQREIAKDTQKAAEEIAEKAAAAQALSSAQKRLGEMHRRVAQLLRSGSGEILQGAPLQYWEKRSRGGQTREIAYQASSLLQLKPESFERLQVYYGQPETAAQAKMRAVSYFPLLGFRYDPSVMGAIVTHIDEQSPLLPATVQVGDIVVSIGGREVHSALEFSKLADQAVADRAEKDIFIKVQRGEQLLSLTLPKIAEKPPEAELKHPPSRGSRKNHK